MTDSQLQALLALGEGFTTEFKRSGTSNLGRELCAFANATGGVVLIGVEDDGSVVGVSDANKLKSEVQAVARSADPPIAVEVECVDKVLVVQVPAQNSKPYSNNGKFYLREGASSQQMKREEIREFFFKEGLIRFDETPCDRFDLPDDLTPAVWKRFAKRCGLSPDLDSRQTLRNLHLLSDEGMTHAGAWLLAEDITKFTLRASVTCAMFRGSNKTHILDRKDFTGDLHQQFDDCMAYLQAKLNTALIPNASGREERLEFPEEALREAVVNALAHRDFRSAANVQIHLFHDRLEIITPGGLPAGMREEDLGMRSVPRNPLLFGLLFRMGLVEQVGSGIKRIRDACDEYRIAPPKTTVSENFVTTIFTRATPEVTPEATPEATPEVSSEVMAMLRLLHSVNDALSRGDMMEYLRLKDEKHFREHYQQTGIQAGVIEMTIPDRPKSPLQRYRISSLGEKLVIDDSLGKEGGK